MHIGLPGLGIKRLFEYGTARREARTYHCHPAASFDAWTEPSCYCCHYVLLITTTCPLSDARSDLFVNMPHGKAFRQIKALSKGGTGLFQSMATAVQDANSPIAIQCCRQFSSVRCSYHRSWLMTIHREGCEYRDDNLQAAQGCFKASDLMIQRIEQPKARQDTKVWIFYLLQLQLGLSPVQIQLCMQIV